jgi:DNA-binding MarR family transcriptional regulator
MTVETARARARNSEEPDLSPRDYRLLAEFRYLLARFLAFSESAAEQAGLSPRQHQALLAIKGHPGGPDVTVGDLAERLCIRHHSAVGLVDRLVAGGYLARRTDRHDGRRILVSLTPRGDRALAGLSAIHRAELRRITPLLKPVLAKLAPQERQAAQASPERPRRRHAHD